VSVKYIFKRHTFLSPGHTRTKQHLKPQQREALLLLPRHLRFQP